MSELAGEEGFGAQMSVHPQKEVLPPALSDLFESTRLIGSNVWALFSSAPASTQTTLLLKSETASDHLRHRVVELSREVNVERLLQLLDSADPRVVERIDVDFFYGIAKKINKSQSIESYASFVKVILRAYGYNSTFVKTFFAIERDVEETEIFAKYLIDFDSRESLGEPCRQFLAKLICYQLERLAQHGRFENFLALLCAQHERMKSCENIDYQKTLHKLLFALLQSCLARQEGLDLARKVICDFHRVGFDFTVFIFNKILDMLNKGGDEVSLNEFVLSKMQELSIAPNLVTFNTIMDNYCIRGEFEKAYAIFEALPKHGFAADNFTFSIIIKGIKNMPEENVKTADKFLELYQSLFDFRDIIIYNSIIDVYISFGLIDRAHTIYERMTKQLALVPDQITFNTLIKGCCKLRDFPHALQYFQDMKKYLLKPNRITYNSLMDLAVKIQDMSKALFFVEQMQVDGISPDGYTYSILLNGLKLNNSSNALVEASLSNILQVIESNEIKLDEVFFNSILDVCSKYEFYERLRFFYGLMREKRVPESPVTYGIMIKSYGKLGDFDAAYAMFEAMLKSSMPINEITYGCILDACAKTGNMDIALRIYNSLKDSKMNLNSIVFTTIMKGFLKNENYDAALAFFEKVRVHKQLTGILITFNCALDCLVRKGDVEASLRLFREIDSSFGADLISYSTIIKGICATSRKDEAYGFVRKMLDSGIESDISVINLFLDSCANQQDFRLAIQAYQFIMTKNVHPNEITFGVMIKVFGFARDVQKAFELLDLMAAYKINPSIVIYTNLIHISFYNKNAKKAEAAFSIFKRTGMRGDRLMYSKLIDGLLRFADVSRTLKYLDEAIKDQCSLKPETIQRLEELEDNDGALESRLRELHRLSQNPQNGRMTANKDRFKNNYTQENTKRFKQIIREEQAKNPAEAQRIPKRNSSKGQPEEKEQPPRRPLIQEKREPQEDTRVSEDSKKAEQKQKPLTLFNFRKRIAS